MKKDSAAKLSTVRIQKELEVQAIRVFGLAAVLLLASLVWNTSSASAQGPWTPQAIVDAFVAKGGKVTGKSVVPVGLSDGTTVDMCKVVVKFFNVFVPTLHAGGGYGTHNAAAEIGMNEIEFLKLTGANASNDGRNFGFN